MTRLLNRTVVLWLFAIGISWWIVNPQRALVQRANSMNEYYIASVNEGNYQNPKYVAEAIEHYHLLAELYPQYGRGFEMEGMCYLGLKQDRLAVRKFQEAVQHNPDLFWVYLELGKAYYRQGLYAKAFDHFQKIIMQGNDVLLKKGTISALRGVPDKSKQMLMVELINFIADVRLQSYQMAIGALLHQGNLDQAGRMIEEGLKDQGAGSTAFFDMARRSLADENSKKNMLGWIDSLAQIKPSMHPWGRVIQPLKELFL